MKESRSLRTSQVVTLLFFSGACALIYQMAWVRLFRLIFGASTAASAAVLAVFMAGLGVGGLVLGKRIEASKRPALRIYANLEIAVACSAALSPALVWISRKAYVALGGASTLGSTGATLARLALAILVLLGPTLLMGGTLPAAARAISTNADHARRGVAALYGVNTLGAVVGALLADFLLLEVFGNSLTLLMTCLVNILVGLAARMLARQGGEPRNAAPESEQNSEKAKPLLPVAQRLPWLPPAAAGIAGFAFLLMELVWYRMLAPILGGSSYTFGLILALALLGIGLGGVLYALFSADRQATLGGFALTCSLEALFLAIPFALGDRLAILALFLRPLGTLGFLGHVAAWALIAAIVVVPAAIVSGFQFPLIIALFGQGRERVARQVGVAYAANTVGAIVGSLAGGFGLLPKLTAPGCWRLVVVLLVATALTTIAFALRSKEKLIPILLSALAAPAALVLLQALGPTATWRHSPIGVGRLDYLAQSHSLNPIVEYAHAQRRGHAWEEDGLESTVALSKRAGYTFIVNGKSDGDARYDAGTQVMGGLVGAALLGDPKNAFVVGLGTGSTAGWLAQIPGLERVDVAELEPSILRVARDCSPVNHNVLDNPKVRVTIGDAREVLLTTRERYDLIVSEPSNPYRAGISSLYTREFYEASTARLTDRGLFLQWLQAYEIDGATVRVALVTMASVFPHVSLWEPERGDLLLVGGKSAELPPAGILRARLHAEPYRSALLFAWRTYGLEGFLARHVARPDLTRWLAEQFPFSVNTDDRNLLEYALARTAGRSRGFVQNQVWALSQARKTDRPQIEADWARVESARVDEAAGAERDRPSDAAAPERKSFYAAMGAYHAGDLRSSARAFQAFPREPVTVLQQEMMAESLAEVGSEAALGHIDALRPLDPIEADLFLARLLLRQGKLRESLELYERGLIAYRTNPWPRREALDRAIELGAEYARDRDSGRRVYELLGQPFSMHLLEETRLSVRLKVALAIDRNALCVEAFAPFEPVPLWTQSLLQMRYACYQAAHHPLEAKAASDLEEFVERLPLPLVAGAN